MKLHEPFIITARLLPGVKIGDSFISIELAGETCEGRTRYRYHIDTPDFEHTSSDLKSGCGGGDLVQGMSSLLSFLGAAAEAYNRPDSDNADLFPPNVTEWAYQHSDETSRLQCEIEESEIELIEA